MRWALGRASRSLQGVAPAFRRGDALVNATRLSKTFDASRGLTAWRLSVAGGRPQVSPAAEARSGRE